MKMTFDDYDLLCDLLSKIPDFDPEWMPEREDIDKYVIKDFEKYHAFIIWLSEVKSGVGGEEGRELMKYINSVLYENLVLVDEDDLEEESEDET